MELKHSKERHRRNGIWLLIVPYGIETQTYIQFMMSLSLLIVPYGIETREPRTSADDLRSFNRTLWN